MRRGRAFSVLQRKSVQRRGAEPAPAQQPNKEQHAAQAKFAAHGKPDAPQPKAADQGTGVFTLKAELMDAPADAGGGRLQPGQTRSARLYGGADNYQVQIERAGTYVIDMQSDDIDSSLELLHNGASLAEDDDGGDGLNARIVELLQPGTYTIRARALYNYGGSEGSYRISINRR